jgi:hypothetical protein
MSEHPNTFQKLWRRLGGERRKAAANALLAKGDRAQQTLAANLIATRLKFRPHKAAQLPPERKASYIAGMDSVDEAMAGALIRDYLFTEHRPMLARFLDLLAIPHKNGEIDEKADVTKPTPDALRAAVGNIRTEFNPDEVAIYTSALALSDPDLWGELRTIDTEPAKDEAPAG